jgi:hypothetical protein
MTYRFTTPTISEGPAGEGPLFSRYRLTRGVSVIKIEGEYYEVRNPSTEEIAEAEAFYLGGITYDVNEAEKAGLEAAGYTVETV